MYNPYLGGFGVSQQPNPFAGSYNSYVSMNTQPQQQVIQVDGKASVDMIQLPPNSSELVMDRTAPIVWLCVSDGIGKVTATAYDITPHKDKTAVSMDDVEKRLEAVESKLAEIVKEAEKNVKSDVGGVKSKSRGITD